MFADPEVEAMCRSLKIKDNHAAGLQVAQSQSGLAGIALELIKNAGTEQDKSRIATGSLKYLRDQKVPGPWAFGLELCGGVRYDGQKLAIAQRVLAAQASEPIAGLGMAAARTLDPSYSSPDILQVYQRTIQALDTPSARQGVLIASKTRYDVQKQAIYQAFLSEQEPSTPRELTDLSLRASSKLDASYSGPDQMAIQRTLVDQFAQDPEMGNALRLARDLAGVVRYDVQKSAFFKIALESSQTADEPRALLQQGLTMLQAMDASYSAPDRLKGCQLLLDRLERYPETAALAGLARLMMHEVRYDVQKQSILDSVFQAVLDGQGSHLSVADKALATLDMSYSAPDFLKVAVAVLKQSDNADANLVLEAMGAVRYDNQRLGMARVVFRHLLAPEPPPFSKLARELLDSFDMSYSGQDVVKAGNILGRRYSHPRARTVLDAAQTGQAMKDAFRSIEQIDDDLTEIKNMARTLKGEGPSSTVVEKKGAVLIGGVRLRVRQEDCETAPA
ncbi:hypothetical protein DYH09_29735 [bacterium CPR1]|nr:hypothetical protein [bacterium CPR1]